MKTFSWRTRTRRTSVANKQAVGQLLASCNGRDQTVMKMKEWSESVLNTIRISNHLLLSLKLPFRLYLPVCMLQWWPSKVHASVTMAMTWNWKENKVGRHKQTKKNNKDKGKRSQMYKKKTQRDIHQHKHRSKWLIICTTEFKDNE